ncbi:hypothetical protein CALVIDRAFT_539940 [Calocera viscosa TUFC12733]|uniref:Uncharacterized protein n=1 Tax=Calocera viscosa (strain TUFC12733) TaxID=1330018 RepID=A0A167JDK3_CALVF|nr:hypothetical protein CALVIDRAFT_539940 [Calocera viscosa TUFC12733]
MEYRPHVREFLLSSTSARATDVASTSGKGMRLALAWATTDEHDTGEEEPCTVRSPISPASMNTPPPYSPSSDYSHSSSLSAHLDLPDIDLSSEDDLPPPIDGYLPAPVEALPEYPARPGQYVFLSLDVLNSAVVDAATGERVMESVSPLGTEGESGSETLIRFLPGEEGPETNMVCRIAWPCGSGRRALAGPTVDFGGGALLLRKWMARTGDLSALLRIRHRGRMYDVYQAGPALGVRYTPSKSTRQPMPMLLAIRDPLKHTELLVSPLLSGRERERREMLEIGTVLTVLLKSKRQLGADFEERRFKDRLWRGVDRCFRSIGNAQPGQVRG